MKIYVSHSRAFNYADELYKPLRDSSLNNSHKFFLPHGEGRDIDNYEVLKGSDMIVAEVSFRSTGQGIELGWAHGLEIPILCISKEDATISSSLNHVADKFLKYSSSQELITKLSDFLTKP